MSNKTQHSARRISLALVMTIVVQVASILIWATQLNARVNGMEQQCAATGALSEKFARLDEHLDGMKQDLSGVKHQLDRLTDRLLK